MRKMVCCLVFTCACTFAQSVQSAPDNAATEALKKRLEGLNLMNLQPLPKPGPQPVILKGPVTPKICSIPLLEVKPPGTADKMHVVAPKNPAPGGDTVQVPAPPCAAGAFTNPK